MDAQLLRLLIVVIVVGAALYIVSIVPGDATFKAITRVIVLVFFAIYALTILFRYLPA